MITSEDIINLGFKRIGAISNGGSLIFARPNSGNKYPISITSNSNNFYYKKTKDPKLNEIEIEKIHYSEDNKPYLKQMWIGIPDSLEHLIALINEIE